MQIVLRPITRDNWQECIKLQVSRRQKDFVASNLYSLAQSKFEPELMPMGIYSDEIMVGFIMFGLQPEKDGCYWIHRIMIDRRHQKKGYGRQVLQQVINDLKQRPNCRKILLSYVPRNNVAERLYLGLGFEKTGEIYEGENVLCLKV